MSGKQPRFDNVYNSIEKILKEKEMKNSGGSTKKKSFHYSQKKRSKGFKKSKLSRRDRVKKNTRKNEDPFIGGSRKTNLFFGFIVFFLTVLYCKEIHVDNLSKDMKNKYIIETVKLLKELEPKCLQSSVIFPIDNARTICKKDYNRQTCDLDTKLHSFNNQYRAICSYLNAYKNHNKGYDLKTEILKNGYKEIYAFIMYGINVLGARIDNLKGKLGDIVFK